MTDVPWSPLLRYTFVPYSAVAVFYIFYYSGHPFLRDINEALLGMQEEGVLEQLYDKWWMNRECESNAAATGYHSAALVLIALISIMYLL